MFPIYISLFFYRFLDFLLLAHSHSHSRTSLSNLFFHSLNSHPFSPNLSPLRASYISTLLIRYICSVSPDNEKINVKRVFLCIVFECLLNLPIKHSLELFTWLLRFVQYTYPGLKGNSNKIFLSSYLKESPKQYVEVHYRIFIFALFGEIF